jgi:hypothetical protein
MVTIDNEAVEDDSEGFAETPEESAEVDAPAVVLGDAETEVTEEGDTNVDAGDTVVVVDAAPAAEPQSDAVLEQVIDDAVSLAILSQRMDTFDSRLFALEAAEVVEAAEEAAEDAEVLDALEEEPESDESEESDDDEGFFESAPEPKSAKAHPLFRPFSEWRNK